MRAVLMSIKPEWWEKILAGEKDLEIRKTVPAGGAEVPWPLRVLVYSEWDASIARARDYCLLLSMCAAISRNIS